MTWQEVFNEEMKKEYFRRLQEFVDLEYNTSKCYPPKEKIYKAFELSPLDMVKVVILGQDPYPTEGVAMGLAFSVNKETKIPKSLHNMFLELESDLGFAYPSNGDLTSWCLKGILLLNRILTVRKSMPLSHKDKGWELFTERIIKEINKQDRKIVFILLGNEAKKIKKYLDNPKHLIIEAPHPSPLSAYHGFFGSKIYSKTCEYLDESKDMWRLKWLVF